jgi:uncharacterized DUF497 family protein
MLIWKEPLEFEWDEGNLEKAQKHGVSKTEIEQAYFDKKKQLLFDEKHSFSEERYILVGRNKKKRWIYTSMTIRNEKVRIFSARYMHKKEVELYEKATNRT